jgi:hypothetical protein
MEKDTVAAGEPAFALLRIVKLCASTVPVGISPNLSGLGVENESWSPNGVSPSDTTCCGSSGTSVEMMSSAANADGVGFGAGDGTASAVTVTVAKAPGMSGPCGGSAVAKYCAAPGPVGRVILHVKSAVPSFRTTNDCAPGAGPPHVAANESDEGAIVTPPPNPLPETERGVGSPPQVGPVTEAIPRLPVTPLATRAVNVAATPCAARGSIVNAAGETVNGEEEASAESFADTASVTSAGALPVLTTLKCWVKDLSSPRDPKLPKLGVGDVSKARIAPLGSSVRVITCGAASASVSIVRVPEMGVTGELAATEGAVTVIVKIPPENIARPTLTLVENPGAPANETEVT